VAVRTPRTKTSPPTPEPLPPIGAAVEVKGFEFELKNLSDEGEFDGYAAVYGNVDHDNDVIEPGALTKTVAERSRVPILWQHDPRQPIGVGELSIDGKGLAVKGKLTMQVQRAKEAHALMQDGALGGLSIGYRTVKKAYQDGVRRLKEVAVHEFSPVTFPSNELATFGSVKGFLDELRDGSATKANIAEAIEALQALLDVEPGAGPLDKKGAADLEVEPDLRHSLLALNQTMREAVAT